MSESGFYPPGAEHDPRAPWNEREPEDCSECGGSGELLTEQETRQPGTTRPCPRCEGTGNEPEIDEGPDPDDLRDAELDRRMNGE